MRKNQKGKKEKGEQQIKTSVPPKGKYIPALIIAVIGFLLYANTLNHEFVLDDNSAIENNWLVKQGSKAIPELFKTSYRYGFWKGEDELYRPLPLSIFAVMWEKFPGNPFPFHLLNVLLYSLTGFILFIVLQRILSSYNILIPFIATLVFMVHPVHTEVVANIKSMDEVLSLLFLLFSIQFIYRYTDHPSVISIISACVMFFIALMAKESSITFLALVPLILYFFSNARPARIAGVSAVLLIPAALYLIIRADVLGSVTSSKNFAFIDNIMYAAPDFMIRLATALSILLKYLFILFLPLTLSSDFTYPQIELNGWDTPAAWISLMLHAGILVYAILNLKKKNISAFIILFYLFSMALYSNIFVVIGSPFAERFLYIPSIAFSVLMALLIIYIARINPKDRTFHLQAMPKNFLLMALVLLVCIPYAYKTIARNHDWKSNYELFKADATNSPRSARIHYFYANEIRKQKAMKAAAVEERNFHLNESIKEYNRSIELYPDYADPYGQMGMSYYRLGDRKKAYELYTKSIGLSTTSSTVYNNMAVLYSEAGQHREALEYYKKAVFYDPYYYDGWKNLGNTYAELGDHQQAVDAFLNAMKYKDDDADTIYFLAISLQTLGRSAEAGVYFEKAYALNPDLRGN